MVTKIFYIISYPPRDTKVTFFALISYNLQIIADRNYAVGEQVILATSYYALFYTLK